MKKIFTFVAVAALAVACCNKTATVVTVENFFENPKAFVAQDTTITGTIQGGCVTGQFTLGTADNDAKKQLLIIPVTEDVKLCPGCVGKEMSIKGLIAEVIVDTEFITNLENEANADENAEIKEAKLKKAGEFRETLSTGGVFSIYSITTTAITAKDGQAAGCKSGEKACCEDGHKAIAEGGEKACCQDGHKAMAEGGKADCCEGKEAAHQCEKACEKKVE